MKSGCDLTMRCLPLKRWGYQLIVARLQVTVVIAVCLPNVARSLIFRFCPVIINLGWTVCGQQQVCSMNWAAAIRSSESQTIYIRTRVGFMTVQKST